MDFAAIFSASGIFFLFLSSFLIPPQHFSIDNLAPTLSFWPVRSIDTMKYSRDLSREKMNDAKFDEVIDSQLRNIAATGATHAGIGTPYDKEFIPMLTRWVKSARKYNLKVWFRGNLSGWEKWFGYEGITRDNHIESIKKFIIENPGLFEDGDIFSSCPECENGGLGDPRKTGDTVEYRKFLICEYETAKAAFRKIGKQVDANYFSMNYDVASLIMDKETTSALGGKVVIDHYVASPEKLVKDAEYLAAKSGGKIVFGEFGAPIPNIHGYMAPEEQAQWIKNSLFLLAGSEEVIGINYWVNVGGSTGIWDSKGKQSPSVEIIRDFYKPDTIFGRITDTLYYPVHNAEISGSAQTVLTGKDGYFKMPVPKNSGASLRISAPGFKAKDQIMPEFGRPINIMLEKNNEDSLFKMRLFVKNTLEAMGLLK